jgi:putative phosphoesterase
MKEYGKQQNIDVVIFGHSHKSFIDNQTQPFLFNPGSVSLPRDLSATYGIIEIDKNKLTMLIEHLK